MELIWKLILKYHSIKVIYIYTTISSHVPGDLFLGGKSTAIQIFAWSRHRLDPISPRIPQRTTYVKNDDGWERKIRKLEKTTRSAKSKHPSTVYQRSCLAKVIELHIYIYDYIWLYMIIIIYVYKYNICQPKNTLICENKPTGTSWRKNYKWRSQNRQGAMRGRLHL